MAACSEKAIEPAQVSGKKSAPAAKGPERPALLSTEARIAADAELKRRNVIADLVEVHATVSTQYADLARCRVVHDWSLIYHSPAAPAMLVAIVVGTDADRKTVVRNVKQGPPRPEDGPLKPVRKWNFGAEEAVASVARHPRVSCTDSIQTFFMRMDTVAGNEAPVWFTPYSIGGRQVAVDASTRQLLEVAKRSDSDAKFTLTPLEPQ